MQLHTWLYSSAAIQTEERRMKTKQLSLLRNYQLFKSQTNKITWRTIFIKFRYHLPFCVACRKPHSNYVLHHGVGQSLNAFNLSWFSYFTLFALYLSLTNADIRSYFLIWCHRYICHVRSQCWCNAVMLCWGISSVSFIFLTSNSVNIL